MVPIFAYFDYQCPHSYVALPAVERARLARDVHVVWRPVELYAEPGLPLVGLSDDPTRFEAEVGALVRQAALEGLPFRMPTRTIDTSSARQAAEFARDVGGELFARVHRALFRAFFGEGADLGDREVLLDVCEDVGLDRHGLAASLEDRRYEERLAEVAGEADRYGVEQLPSYLVGQYRIVGSAPPDVLIDTIDRAAIALAESALGESDLGR